MIDPVDWGTDTMRVLAVLFLCAGAVALRLDAAMLGRRAAIAQLASVPAIIASPAFAETCMVKCKA